MKFFTIELLVDTETLGIITVLRLRKFLGITYKYTFYVDVYPDPKVFKSVQVYRHVKYFGITVFRTKKPD